jgi:hypothetical protein
MRVITAPEEYERQKGDVFCFLAGGISDCPEWQEEVIQYLERMNLDRLVIFNPRMKNFPIDDPNASEKQIRWEFKYLEQADIFSMYFCKSESVQPICMYELGRNLTRFAEKPLCVAVSVEDGYKRATDVEIQSQLALGKDYVYRNAIPIGHAINISMSYKYLVCLGGGMR